VGNYTEACDENVKTTQRFDKVIQANNRPAVEETASSSGEVAAHTEHLSFFKLNKEERTLPLVQTRRVFP